MQHPSWKIWIDTGGTFTDCIARSPQGVSHRLKVLSSGCLRLTLKGFATLPPSYAPPATFSGAPVEIWFSVGSALPGPVVGYTLAQAGSDAPIGTVVAVSGQTALCLRLSGPAPLPERFPIEAELSAGEEAPILAARLVTQTPLGQPLPPAELKLGSTKGTNALLERKTAACCLLITEGFADLPLIRNQQRPHLFSLSVQKIPPLCQSTIEVKERLDHEGYVLLPLSEEEVQRVVSAVVQTRVESVAVALLHSYRNPAHEQRLGVALQEAGIRYVSLSSALSPGIRLLPRMETALVDAALQPIIRTYLQGVERHLAHEDSPRRFRVMSSSGSLAGSAFFRAKDSLLSGPAGGVIGAGAVARELGLPQVITLDMGGTSTDVARAVAAGQDRPDYRYESQVAGAIVAAPSLAIETVAAGGGSICRVTGQQLSVGPESAGARPGPACYGGGGPLTITDVNLLLGRIAPGNFSIPISLAHAQEALRQLMSQLPDAAPEEVLNGFLQIANEKMANAIRQISVAKGYDAAEYTLMAFGGAAGQHACAVAGLLGMRSVLVPADASLLSAWGIGQAAIERFALRQLLCPLEQALVQLPALIAQMQAETEQALRAELPGYIPAPENIRLSLFMRLSGQETAIEVDATEAFLAGSFRTEAQAIALAAPLSQEFDRLYERLYGYLPEHRQHESQESCSGPLRSIEVESVRWMGWVQEEPPGPPLPRPEPLASERLSIPHQLTHFFGSNGWQDVPLFQLADLPPGCVVSGPALIAGNNTTATIDPGWKCTVWHGQHLLMEHVGQLATAPQQQVEAAATELFANRFKALAEEMGSLLQRTSFSVNVKERLDFSCALLDPEGYLVANAPHIPVHLGSLGLCVRRVVEALPLGPGDVAITNHPGFGGSHLPDVTLIAPAYDAAGTLLGYVANRAHHAEIGGKSPGSMPPDATNLAEEGVVIAPAYLVRSGAVQWEEVEKIFTTGPWPTRNWSENRADLNGALASVRKGVADLERLAVQYGAKTLYHYMRQIRQQAAGLLRSAVYQWVEDGRLRPMMQAQEQLDDGSVLSVRVHLHTEKGAPEHTRITIDFTGTSAMHPGNLNATPAIVGSVVVYVLRLLAGQAVAPELAASMPLNEGLMEPVALILPEGTLLNPVFGPRPESCPAVVGGNTETSQRLTDTLLKALELAACSQGTMNNLLFGDAGFGYYETIGGGCGAGPGFHGADAVHQHMTNTRITDPEMLEWRYPVRLERFAIRHGSGGAGKWQGGAGIIRQLTFTRPVTLTIVAEHRKVAPYGLAGGQSGKPGRQYKVSADGAAEELTGRVQLALNAGEGIIIQTPGGGGYGTSE